MILRMQGSHANSTVDKNALTQDNLQGQENICILNLEDTFELTLIEEGDKTLMQDHLPYTSNSYTAPFYTQKLLVYVGQGKMSSLEYFLKFPV